MKATEIQKLLDATIVCGSLEGIDVLCGCGSDMMSDVLAFPKEKMVLLTGLTNAHTVRTCELLDVCAIVFVRGKIPGRRRGRRSGGSRHSHPCHAAYAVRRVRDAVQGRTARGNGAQT